MWLSKFIAHWSKNEPLGTVLGAMTVRTFQTGISVMKNSITAQQILVGTAFLILLIIRVN